MWAFSDESERANTMVLSVVLIEPRIADDARATLASLLWAADAICWAAGAGGDWRRRIAGVLTVRDLRP